MEGGQKQCVDYLGNRWLTTACCHRMNSQLAFLAKCTLALPSYADKELTLLWSLVALYCFCLNFTSLNLFPSN